MVLDSQDQKVLILSLIDNTPLSGNLAQLGSALQQFQLLRQQVETAQIKPPLREIKKEVK